MVSAVRVRWSSRRCSQAEIPSGISRMMISAASRSATDAEKGAEQEADRRS